MRGGTSPANCYESGLDRSLYFVPTQSREFPQFFLAPSNATEDAGRAFAVPIDSLGFPTPTLAGAPGSALPAGVTFTDGGGGFAGIDVATLSGTASVAPGTYLITLTTTNILGAAEENFTLTVVAAPPPGTTIYGSAAGTNPTLYWERPATLATQGCTGGTATFGVTAVNTVTGNSQTVDEFLSESPTGSGSYAGTIPALYPLHGDGSVSVSVTCPDPSQNQTFTFSIYIDPGGTVVDTTGTPIVGASVTLLSGTSAAGPFGAVANGSTVMSIGNRANPDTTTTGGSFGWDTSPGFYEVEASASGCVSPSDPGISTVTSAPFSVPPPVSTLQLVLSCPPTPPAFTSTTDLTFAGGSPFATPLNVTGSPNLTISLAPGAFFRPA